MILKLISEKWKLADIAERVNVTVRYVQMVQKDAIDSANAKPTDMVDITELITEFEQFGWRPVDLLDTFEDLSENVGYTISQRTIERFFSEKRAQRRFAFLLQLALEDIRAVFKKEPEAVLVEAELEEDDPEGYWERVLASYGLPEDLQFSKSPDALKYAEKIVSIGKIENVPELTDRKGKRHSLEIAKPTGKRKKPKRTDSYDSNDTDY